MSSMFTPVISATMTSLEIAELTGKRHDHVMRDIRLMLAELHGDGGVPSFGDTHRNPQNGQEYPVFRLPRREVEILVTGYSITLRAKVIDRLRELESEVARPRELSRLELIQMALAAEQEKIRIEAERDHAIATKAQIGSKREASAMATASAAVREVNRLKGELGRNSKQATFKAVERATDTKYKKGSHVPMRKWCERNGVTAADVPDETYGTVKAWPAAAWLEVYGVCLDKLFPA